MEAVMQWNVKLTYLLQALTILLFTETVNRKQEKENTFFYMHFRAVSKINFYKSSLISSLLSTCHNAMMTVFTTLAQT